MQGQDQSKVTIDATEKSTDEAERVSIHEGDVGERADKSRSTVHSQGCQINVQELFSVRYNK